MLKNKDGFKLPEAEEKVLEFWKKNNIFAKSLINRKSAKVFNFFEGPPTANGSPGIHHVLSRSFKDIILRYKTMTGYLVPRKAGWDTHGLPVELGVEKKLGLKNKKEIEKYGIEEFNKKCRESVWEYQEEWEHITERMGFWLDMDNPYVTYETSYIESLWHILNTAWKKKLLYKGHKIIPWCTRCGTGLSSHELAQGYKEVADNSLYIKFKLAKGSGIKGKLKADGNSYVVSWTTTAWTLPGNVALAVGEKIKYVVVEAKPAQSAKGAKKTKELWVVAKDIYKKEDSFFKKFGELAVDKNGKPIEITGKELVGKKYEPLWNIKATNTPKSHKIVSADFVKTDDGTGVVHTAVMYGDEDYQLGVKVGLPQHHTVDETGKFTNDVPRFSGLYVKSPETEKKIISYLSKQNNLVKVVSYTHDYPFCWRCSTPLLYYARDSWFIEMSKLRKKMVTANKEINWIPETIKTGRFGGWIKEAKDWAISRDRYWGAPLPIWQCEKGHTKVIDGLDDLSSNVRVVNNFYVLRHGESEHNIKRLIASGNEKGSRVSELTDDGIEQIKAVAEELKKKKITHIFTSPYARTKKTARIVAKITKAKIHEDKRLQEIDAGIFNWKTVSEYESFFDEKIEAFTKAPSGGETLNEIKQRMFDFIRDINSKHEKANILIVGHGDPIWMLEAFVKGKSDEEALEMEYLKPGQWRELPFKNLSYNEKGEIDLHRPYIDSVELDCSECKNVMKRVPALADVWFDSGAMPFASLHYPFENKELLESGIGYPADYIVEGMDQTRGWFYTLLAVSTILGKEPPYKNVISLGLLNDKFGQKMSKSKGNVIVPMEMIDKYGVDVVRWFFYTVNPPGETKNFDENDLTKISRRFFGILYNSFIFYDSSLHKSERILCPYIRHVLDRWIISRLNETIDQSTKLLEKYEIGKAARSIESLVDDLSRWYIRRSRGREEAVRVLGFVLLEISKIMAPFTPFFSDALYRSLSVYDKQSIHLEDWPEAKKEHIDTELNKSMEEVRRLATSALAIRAQEGIKVRQPLASLKLKENKFNLDEELLDVLAEEINVKKIIIDSKLKPSGGGEMELDLNITDELKLEGILREITRAVQSLRSKTGLRPGQKIDVYLTAPKNVKDWLKTRHDVFKFGINANEVNFKKTDKCDAFEELKLDGKPVWIGIKTL